MNQPWRVKTRLFNQRLVAAGKSIQGSVRASAISGTPNRVGLINWLKKFRAMVRFRGWLGVFRCFEM